MRRKPPKRQERLPEATTLPEKPPSTDCLQCLHGKPWKYGLIDCGKAVTAVANCKDRKIECVNFKPKQTCITRQF